MGPLESVRNSFSRFTDKWYFAERTPYFILKKHQNIKQIPKNTAARQIAQQIELEVTDYERKHLPKKNSFIVIVNALGNGVEELVAHQLLDTFEGKVEIISLAKTKVKHLATNFRNNVEQPTAFVIVNDLLTRKWKRPNKYQQSKRFIREIWKVKLPIVPIHLQLEELSKDSTAKMTVSLRIGRQIRVREQEKFVKARHFRKFIRAKIIALRSLLEVKQLYLEPLDPESPKEPIAPPIPKSLVVQDIAQIREKGWLLARGEYDIFVADAQEIPHALQEIGRLREITFRAVGEGTGMSRDIDEYDAYYKQLIIWDREEEQIVGGYRIGEGNRIFSQFGIEGFYIHSLFKIKKGFHSIMQEAIELGRSYIVPDYQRKRLPLFLLWQGIVHFLLQNPNIRYIYGPVSISKYYSHISKSLIVAFVKKFYFNKKLSKYLKPRKPFKAEIKEIDFKALMRKFNGELQSLDNFIADIEPQHFKIPVLLKQYVKQNARFISFNVDPNFSDVLDGFMILAIEDLPAYTLEVMRKETLT